MIVHKYGRDRFIECGLGHRSNLPEEQLTFFWVGDPGRGQKATTCSACLASRPLSKRARTLRAGKRQIEASTVLKDVE